MTKVINNPSPVPLSPLEAALTQVLTDLRYGFVEIIVHDTKVVQIERKEKFRLQDGTLETILPDEHPSRLDTLEVPRKASDDQPHTSTMSPLQSLIVLL